MAGDAPLAAGFAAPTQADWLRLAEKALKGQTLAEVTATTPDGIVLKPLSVAGDAEPVSVRRAEGPAGPGRWDIRTRIAHPAPAAAAAQALEDLEGGASSILLALDPSGADGVVATDPAALAQAIAGVEPEMATIALDAGFLGVQAADWLAAAAKRAPRALLAFQMDPLGAFAAAGASPGPIAAHLDEAARAAARLTTDYPMATAFLASGRAAHEAGGSDAQELALMAAAAVAYLKAMDAAGIPTDRALQAIVLGVSVDGEFLTGVAKVRAARLIWDQIARACGPAVSARIEARSSRRMLSRKAPWTNLLRLTAAGFAAAVGGADAVMLEPFIQPLGRPTDLARRQARNTQLVLMEEAHLARVADPAAGSWTLDGLTGDLARAAWDLFQAIEREGGAAQALTAGTIAEAVSRSRDAGLGRYAEGKAKLVGVNLFAAATEEAMDLPQVDAAAFARPAPDAALPGPDDACPALLPMRWAESFEAETAS